MTAQAATKPAALQRDAAPAPGSRQKQRAPKAAPHKGATGPAASISRTLVVGVEHWLNWQCRMIVGVHHGAVYVPQEGQGGLQAVAYWPQRNAGSAVMLGFAEQAYSVRRSVLHKAADDRDQAAEVRDFVAFPLSVNGQVLGVIALALEIRSEAQRQAVVQLLEWGSVWLENTLQGVHTDRREDAQLALEVVATLAANLPLPVSAHQACNRLAETFRCSRVALGVVHGMQVRVEALSDQVQFDRRMDRIMRVRAAMEECVDQEEQERQRQAAGRTLPPLPEIDDALQPLVLPGQLAFVDDHAGVDFTIIPAVGAFPQFAPLPVMEPPALSRATGRVLGLRLGTGV